MRLKGITFGNGLHEEAVFSFSFFRATLFTWVSEGTKINVGFIYGSGLNKEEGNSASSGSVYGIALSHTKVPRAPEMLWHSLVGIATDWRVFGKAKGRRVW